MVIIRTLANGSVASTSKAESPSSSKTSSAVSASPAKLEPGEIPKTKFVNRFIAILIAFILNIRSELTSIGIALTWHIRLF